MHWITLCTPIGLLELRLSLDEILAVRWVVKVNGDRSCTGKAGMAGQIVLLVSNISIGGFQGMVWWSTWNSTIWGIFWGRDYSGCVVYRWSALQHQLRRRASPDRSDVPRLPRGCQKKKVFHPFQIDHWLGYIHSIPSSCLGFGWSCLHCVRTVSWQTICGSSSLKPQFCCLPLANYVKHGFSTQMSCFSPSTIHAGANFGGFPKWGIS